MSINKKCPNCGSNKVQLSSERHKHGFLWFILFGWIWIIWWLYKAIAALTVLACWDWWRAIVNNKEGKGYVWLSKRMIQNNSKTYYCHECHHNFRG